MITPYAPGNSEMNLAPRITIFTSSIEKGIAITFAK